MLLGIRSQLTIFVIMRVSSTCFNLRVSTCIYTHTCTYTHTDKSDNKSEKIICYNEKGAAIYNVMR